VLGHGPGRRQGVQPVRGFRLAVRSGQVGHTPGKQTLSQFRHAHKAMNLAVCAVSERKCGCVRTALRTVRAAFAFSHLFACIQAFEGVNEKHELIRLRREHDSTGLRAKPKLNTPLLRCASPENTRAVSVASETIQQNGKMGSLMAPHFILRVVATH